MELIVDIGNSSAKIAIFEERNIVFQDSCRNDFLKPLDEIIGKYPIKRSIVSTVAGLKGKVGPQLREAGLPTVRLTDETPP